MPILSRSDGLSLAKPLLDWFRIQHRFNFVGSERFEGQRLSVQRKSGRPTSNEDFGLYR
jgi:hypothetical protein